MSEETLPPFTWGAGRSYASLVSKSINDLTDDELTHIFTIVPMHQKLPFLNEMKRRDIKSFTIDLEGDTTDEKLMEAMETFALYDEHVGGSGMSYFSQITGITGEHTRIVDRGESFMTLCTELRKTNAPLLKKKPKFYQTLNKKGKGVG